MDQQMITVTKATNQMVTQEAMEQQVITVTKATNQMVIQEAMLEQQTITVSKATDQMVIQEVMEQQVIHVAKAGIQEQDMGEHCIEAGALMLPANDGVCCIDEFDNMDSTNQMVTQFLQRQQCSALPERAKLR